MKIKSKKIYIAVSIIILAVLVLGAWKSRENKKISPEKEGSFMDTYTKPSDPVRSAEGGATDQQSNGASILSYTHPVLGFMFSYPGNYKVSNLADDQGETVLIQDNGKGTQIYITDFTAKVDFNSALVRNELKGQKIENLKDIVMPAGFNAISFSSSDAFIGQAWDVWFVQNKKLYQITSQAGHDALLKSLVESFKFE